MPTTVTLSFHLTILSIPVLVTAVPLEVRSSGDSDNVSHGKRSDMKELSDLFKGIYWKDAVLPGSGEQFSIIRRGYTDGSRSGRFQSYYDL
jgi:hypothetical protein